MLDDFDGTGYRPIRAGGIGAKLINYFLREPSVSEKKASIYYNSEEGHT